MSTENNYIFVKEQEYKDYVVSANRRNRVLRFWIDIFRVMPLKLKKEAKQKATNLVGKSQGEFEITGAIPYQFETQGASEELSKYLDQFAVFVEHDTPEIHKWRESLKDIKLKIKSNTVAI
jgi:hypothetical protein